MSAKASSLVKKLVKILGEAEKVKKSGMNTYAGYQYTTEADLLELIRPKLVAEGIFIFSSVIETTKEGEITTVVMEHTFVDSETGEERVVRSAGQGADKQDKGIYKALTGSMKYMLWKNFMVESNDDPEADNANPGYVRNKQNKTENKSAAPVKASSTKPSTPVKQRSFKNLTKSAPETKTEEPKKEVAAAPTEEKTEQPKVKSFGGRQFKTQTGEAKF